MDSCSKCQTHSSARSVIVNLKKHGANGENARKIVKEDGNFAHDPCLRCLQMGEHNARNPICCKVKVATRLFRVDRIADQEIPLIFNGTLAQRAQKAMCNLCSGKLCLLCKLQPMVVKTVKLIKCCLCDRVKDSFRRALQTLIANSNRTSLVHAVCPADQVRSLCSAQSPCSQAAMEQNVLSTNLSRNRVVFWDHATVINSHGQEVGQNAMQHVVQECKS